MSSGTLTAATVPNSGTSMTVVMSTTANGVSANSSTYVSAGADIARVALTLPKIESAVLGYIQAIRSLDRTQVTTSEIASALAIPEAHVISAIPSLKGKGVKIVR